MGEVVQNVKTTCAVCEGKNPEDRYTKPGDGNICWMHHIRLPALGDYDTETAPEHVSDARIREHARSVVGAMTTQARLVRIHLGCAQESQDLPSYSLREEMIGIVSTFHFDGFRCRLVFV